MLWPLARIYDRFMRETERACLAAWRAELLAGLAGTVLEVGAGTLANLPYYPPAVTRLVLAEPDRNMRALAHRALATQPAATRARVELCDAPAERLPFADASFDAAVCTLVLCSVRDPAAALGEIRRVLRPGGALVFIEHVAAEDDPARYAWQRRIEPVWRPLAGNCHLTRRTAEAIAAAGFALETVHRESLRKSLPFARPSVRGIARRV